MSTRRATSTIPLDRVFYRIGDVARLVGVKTHVLRFWEMEFSGIAPAKSKSGQRVYRRMDVEHVLLIKHLLYVERFSIEGARRRIRELKRSGLLHETLQLALLPLPGWVSAWTGIEKMGIPLREPVESIKTIAHEFIPLGSPRVSIPEGMLMVHARRLVELTERPITEFFLY